MWTNPNAYQRNGVQSGTLGSDHAGSRSRHVADYIAGMTDRFALDEHRRLYDVYEEKQMNVFNKYRQAIEEIVKSLSTEGKLPADLSLDQFPSNHPEIRHTATFRPTLPWCCKACRAETTQSCRTRRR